MSEHDASSSRSYERWAGPALFLTALALYLVTGARYPVPGDISYQLAHQVDALPLASMLQPVWGALVRTLAKVGWPSLAGAVSVVSALCGAAVVWLVYSVTARIRRQLPGTHYTEAASRLAGTAAALFLMVSTPFWYASTRPDYNTFDLLLLVGAIRLLQSYGDSGRAARLYAAAALCGVAMPEYATSLGVAPVLTIYGLVLMIRRGQLRAGLLARVALCAALAPVLYLLAGWYYAHQPMTEWRGLDSYLGLVKVMVLEQLSQLRRAVPRVGWITIFIASCFPWLACALLVRSGRRVEHGRGTLWLYVILILVAVTILFNGPFAPWRLTGATHLLLAPSLLTASSFGLALGGALLIGQGIRQRQRLPVPAWPRPVLAVLALVLAGVAGVRNFPLVDTRPASALHQITSRIVRALAGRDVLLSDGLLDELLALEARDARVPLQLLSLPMMQNSTYRHQLGELVGSPHVAALARVGVWPALSTWLYDDPQVTDRLSVSFTPNFWLLTGHTPVPRCAVYAGTRDASSVNGAQLLAEHEAFWSAVRPALEQITNYASLARSLHLQLAAVANDLGVFLENVGEGVGAERAYAGALELNPNNLSALANRAQLWTSLGRTQEAAQAWARVSELRQMKEHTLPLLALAERDGHVRTRDAAAQILQVAAPASAAPAPEPALTDAVLKHLEGQSGEARALVEKLVGEQPERDEAWLLLAAIAVDMKDEATFQRCLNHMRDQNKEWPEMLLILGQKAVERQDYQSAREYYERAALLRADNPRIHEMLLTMDLHDGDMAGAERRVRSLLTLNPASLTGHYALGVVLAKRRDYPLAEAAFRYVLDRRRDPLVLNNLAWLLQRRGALDEALAMAEEAADLLPHQYSVWDTKGKILLELGRLPEAADCLAEAAKLNAKSTDVRIHLAELARAQGRGEEARAAARQLRAEQPELDEDQQKLLDDLAD